MSRNVQRAIDMQCPESNVTLERTPLAFARGYAALQGCRSTLFVRRHTIQLIFVALSLMLAGGCASPKYGYDNFASPNWDNRHAKFRGELIDNFIGYQYSGLCPNYCQLSTVDAATNRYTFNDYPHKGCTYWYDVDTATRRVINAHFRGTKEACSLTLN